VNLYFAYGSNMHRDVMATHAPTAKPVGVGALANHHFVITAGGYASVEPAHTQTVYGVLWRIGSRDRVRLDAWENIAGGLYRPKILPVQYAGRRHSVLTYIARQQPAGRAKAGYMELVIAAALEWRLPQAYIQHLRRFLPKLSDGVTWRSLKEYGWT
jgi:cation transport regulator ChaC